MVIPSAPTEPTWGWRILDAKDENGVNVDGAASTWRGKCRTWRLIQLVDSVCRWLRGERTILWIARLLFRLLWSGAPLVGCWQCNRDPSTSTLRPACIFTQHHIGTDKYESWGTSPRDHGYFHLDITAIWSPTQPPQSRPLSLARSPSFSDLMLVVAVVGIKVIAGPLPVVATPPHVPKPAILDTDCCRSKPSTGQVRDHHIYVSLSCSWFFFNI